MYYYMQIDPSLIRERNERMRAEMSKLRLEKRLRKHHERRGAASDWSPTSFASRVRSVRFAERILRGSSSA